MPNEPADLSHDNQVNPDRCNCHIYDIETDPTKTIESVQFDYICRFCLGASVRLCANGTVTDSRNLTECPCGWKLNRKVKHLKLISTVPLCLECMTTEVRYQDIPTEWIAIAPGENYPVPTEPDAVNKITFKAKTGPGMTSEISLFVYGVPINSTSVSSSLTTVQWYMFAPLPASLLALKNIGSATIYIRNLTTE